MNTLAINCGRGSKPGNFFAAGQLSDAQIWSAINFDGPHNSAELMPARYSRGLRANIETSAKQNQIKRSRKRGRLQKSDVLLPNESVLGEQNDLSIISPLTDDFVQNDSKIPSLHNSEEQSIALFPSRGAVLQACTVTSCSIGALGVIVRQISHFLHQEGWPIIDCSADISFTFKVWHLELIAGLVVLISLCRYLLLRTWPSFSQSSEAANRQVLTPLEPLDYMVVAFLPGISEELFFRGALLPIFGINWKSVLAVAALFGILHLGSGRKYSFAVWATFVGLVYGYAAISSSSILVPMVSHALNNLVGGIIWRYNSKLSM